MMQTKPARTTVLFYTLLLVAFFAMAAVAPSIAHAGASLEEKQARESLVANMATMTLSVLQDQSKAMKDRQELLQRGFTNVVDTDWIAKFVLGNSWRSASEEQRVRYTELYKTYITSVYVENYAQSNERKITDIKILGIVDAEDERFTTRTKLLLSTGDDVKVDYLVHKKGAGYKIADVIIEGVSLLATHRAEFTAIAANKGIDAVIAKLEMLNLRGKEYARL
jgi:phospholipid transport system substrate-binding protein